MNNRVLNKVIAFSKGKRVMTTLTIKDAKTKDVSEYRRKYGQKAIYIKNGREYVKTLIRVVATRSIDIV